MRAVSKARCISWALLLSWPWMVWAVAKYSPEMIQKGINVSASIWAPLVADTLLCCGGIYAIRSRRGLVHSSTSLKSMPQVRSAYHGPHFDRMAKRHKSNS